jgi:hypothetical protein
MISTQCGASHYRTASGGNRILDSILPGIIFVNRKDVSGVLECLGSDRYRFRFCNRHFPLYRVIDLVSVVGGSESEISNLS